MWLQTFDAQRVRLQLYNTSIQRSLCSISLSITFFIIIQRYSVVKTRRQDPFSIEKSNSMLTTIFLFSYLSRALLAPVSFYLARYLTLPENFIHRWEYTLGGTLQVEAFLHEPRRDEFTEAAVAKHTCVPIHGAFHARHRHERAGSSVIWHNFRHGIEDPAVFNLPSSCNQFF